MKIVIDDLSRLAHHWERQANACSDVSRQKTLESCASQLRSVVSRIKESSQKGRGHVVWWASVWDRCTTAKG